MHQSNLLKKKVLICLVIVANLFLFSTPVFAKKTFQSNAEALETVADKTGIEKTDVPSMFSNIVKVAIGITGLVYLAFMVYAGFKWMTARGVEDDIKTARNTIIAATIGIIIVIGAYAITNFVSQQLIDRATGQYQK